MEGLSQACSVVPVEPISAGMVSGKQGAQVGRPFMDVAYGYLPLVWAATLSHYLLMFLGEAGRILPVCAGARRCAHYILHLLMSRSATYRNNSRSTWSSSPAMNLCYIRSQVSAA